MQEFDFQPRTRVIYGAGAIERLGGLAVELGFRRALLVADQGLIAVGHATKASTLLAKAGVDVFLFSAFDVNPDDEMVENGRVFAAPLRVDSIIGLGGGSSMDCAKGINFLLTNGGSIHDYWGFGKAPQPLLPMIGIPTTAGTGSEAQSYALISDAETHTKMACGDPKAAFRAVILDPCLTLTQPAQVTAVSGYDAVSHAVESYVASRRSPISELFSREAWRLLDKNYLRVLNHPDDLEARGEMQLGAYFAGVAIENSMLGAAHACANPLTARFGVLHGVAIAAMLTHVVRWNSPVAGKRYDELMRLSGGVSDGEGVGLSRRLRELAEAGELPVTLRALGVGQNDLSLLAEEAAGQWTGRFNPRPFDVASALEIYRSAF